MKNRKSKPIALDLFCGCGGVTLGLKKAGFNVVGAVDFNPQACFTYRANHSKVRLIERDIRQVNPNEFDDLIPLQLDLLAICAPCQPFSTQNRKKRTDDARIDLLSESLPFVEYFLPKIVFVENVPGLEANDVFQKFVEKLKSLGYNVSTPIKVNAAELGVPQRRARVVVMATIEIPLSEATKIKKRRRRTVFQTIGDLPCPPVGRPIPKNDPLHFARKHSDLNILRLHHIPADGGGRESLPIELQLACHKGKKSTSFSDTYGRMRWKDVSPTLTTGCTDITRGRFAHPEQHRAITLREAARLQSFPDSYKFLGNTSEIATQIGNAVPPRMMTTIANGLCKLLSAKTNL
jgi:DNA (cytosine-5)-methyltransferase 1